MQNEKQEPGIVCQHGIDAVMTGDIAEDAKELFDTAVKIVRSILDEHKAVGLRGYRIGWTTAPLSLYEKIVTDEGIVIWRLKEGSS
ncbi:MAG: hypothetical protein WC356_03465 [Candidatus Micrarchaeia archaeon]|jgi:hypothetical protein